MALVRVSGPTVEPVSLAEAKRHLRVEVEHEDELILGLIAAAREQAETEQDRALCTSTFDLVLDGWPLLDGRSWYQEIQIPNPPLQSVTSISYVDSTGTTRVLDPSAYQVVTGTPGRIVPAYGTCWPTARCQPGSVTVRYVAGYTSAAAVPGATKAAILLLVGALYENREAIITGTIVAELPTAKALLATDRWGSYP